MASFPPPPPYYKLYTQEARRKHEIRPPKPAGDDDVDVWTPPELLKQPFRKFGQLVENPGSYLEWKLPEGVPVMFKEGERGIAFCTELRRLNKLVLTKYIGLLRALVKAGPQDKCVSVGAQSGPVNGLIHEIYHTFLNITHLLNILRPFQARQTLVAAMTKQIQDRHARAEHLEQSSHQAREFLMAHGIHFDDKGNQIEDPATTPATTTDTITDTTIKTCTSASASVMAPEIDSEKDVVTQGWGDVQQALDELAKTFEKNR